jgi:Amt family ammonium transporter
MQLSRKSPLVLLVLPLLYAVGAPAPAAAQEAAISGADTSWMLMSTALVLLMTPGLAFFYGGLVNSRNALNTMMMSFVALGVSLVLWVVVAYSLAFGSGTAFVGDFSMAMLRGVGTEPNGTIPHMLFMAFQATFAIITAALISGALIGRMRFVPYVAFISIWGLVVYAPVAHWVWGGGWLSDLGALDFAGGTVVHVNAGIAALVAALVLGSRREYARTALLPHNVPFVLLGAGLLWFGWFGFNGGSALAADGIAALAFVNTLVAPAAALVVWALLDYFRTGNVTAVGVATAIVVGLVAITPASGFISPTYALLLGAIAAVPSYFMLQWRARSRLDDSLDVFAAHGIGGMSGAILTGVFASAAVGGADGLLSGNPGQVGIQAIAIVAVAAYCGVMTFIILKVIGLVSPLRPSEKEEARGMDLLNHGEEAYASSSGAILLLDEEMNGGPSAESSSRTPAGSTASADPTDTV